MKFNNRKWLALPLSLLLALNLTVQTSLAYIVTETEPKTNTFVPFDSIEGGLIISKLVEHPYGETYTIPEHVSFDFEVDLGALYAGYTVVTTQGEIIADDTGKITLSVKPGVPVGIEGIDEGMEVTVTELTMGAGFSAKAETTRNAVISPDDFVTLEFVNVYNPVPVTPENVKVSGTKILEGREWQEGDTFEFLLEQEDENGEWMTLGTTSAAYDAQVEVQGSFDLTALIQTLDFTQLGEHSFRVSEVPGSDSELIYDETINHFDIIVSDDDMDGSLEIADVTSKQNAVVEKDEEAGAYNVGITFTNALAETTTESTTTETTTESTTTETTTESTTTETTTESTTTDTTTESTTTETTTESTTTTTGSATWTIGTVSAHAGDKNVCVPITVTGDTGLWNFLFALQLDEGPVLNRAELGEAYAALGLTEDLEALIFNASNAGLAYDIVVENGETVIYLYFDIPEDVQPGRYNIGFNGDVNATNYDGVPLNITEEGGYIQILAPDVVQTGYEYDLEGTHKFYFSHDPIAFKPEDLVTSITRYAVYSDGTKGEAEVLTDVSAVQFNVEGWTNPEEVFNAHVPRDENNNVLPGYLAYYTGSIPATLTDEYGTHEFEGVGTAYIAVKGDVTLTGEVNARDAAKILVYAAAIGSGKDAHIYTGTEEDALFEYFAYFLGDVDGESEDYGATDSLGNEKSDLNARDSAAILVYAAQWGSGKRPDWSEILRDPLPYYTREIAIAKGMLTLEE